MAFKVLILHRYTIFYYSLSSPCSSMSSLFLLPCFLLPPLKNHSIAFLKLLYPYINMPFSSFKK